MLEVEREALVPHRGRHLFHHVAIVATRIVDEHPDRSVARDCGREKALVSVGIAHVAGAIRRTRVSGGHRLGDEAVAATLARPAERHARPLRGECAHEARADARAAA